MTVTTEKRSATFDDARRIVLAETEQLLDSVPSQAWDRVGERLYNAGSVFVIGNGRSGLAAQMAAMRLMHLGLSVHVAGEVTAPAIGAGDLLVAVSGSGTTATVVAAAETAQRVGADVVAVTIATDSPLAKIADEVLALPAADKQDHSATVTDQYAGSLFEQALLLAFDALFHVLWRNNSQSADSLWSRHANLG